MNSFVKVLQYQLFMIPNGQLHVLRSSIYKAIFLAMNNFLSFWINVYFKT